MSSNDEGPEPGGAARRPLAPVDVALALATAAVLAVAVGTRVWASSDLWLDEAQSVAIARLPVGDLLQALREDGSPPLYYLLLHAWIGLFGTGDLAVRSLSSAFALAALPVAWDVGRRLAGRRAAWAAVVVVGSSPFAIRFATEARMYSLLTLLGLAAVAAVLRVRERQGIPQVLAVAGVTGALLLTHYWTAPFLLVGGLLVLAHLLTSARRASFATGLGMALGALAFVPWLPSFRFQLERTGAPWAPPAQPEQIVLALTTWAGGSTRTGTLLLAVLVACAVLGALALRPGGTGSEVIVDAHGSPHGRLLAIGSVGALLFGLILAGIAGVPFAFRYSATGLGPFLLLVALGIGAMPRRATRVAALATIAVLGLGAGARSVVTPRTTAGQVAASLREGADEGDVVVYCPDQFGPAVARLAPGLDQRTFPTGARPERLSWVDYASRNRAGDPAATAQALLAEAAGETIWLVFGEAYLTYEGKCEALEAALAAARTAVHVRDPAPPPRGLPALGFETPYLIRYDERPPQP